MADTAAADTAANGGDAGAAAAAARRILGDFEAASSAEILGVLEGIIPSIKNGLVGDYLAGKIKAARGAGDESQKKEMCAKLRPYLEWLVQGADA